MFIAEVIGTVVSPVQHASLDGRTLLLLRPLDPEGKASGKTRIGIDRTQAGLGDRVIVIDEGNSGRQLIGVKNAPVKTIVVGVIDTIELGGSPAYSAHTQAQSPNTKR